MLKHEKYGHHWIVLFLRIPKHPLNVEFHQDLAEILKVKVKRSFSKYCLIWDLSLWNLWNKHKFWCNYAIFKGFLRMNLLKLENAMLGYLKKMDTDHFFEEFVIILSNFHQMKSNLKHYFELDLLSLTFNISAKTWWNLTFRGCFRILRNSTIQWWTYFSCLSNIYGCN